MENATGGVQSVARIFKLIEVLCAHPGGASLQAISAQSALAKSTTHRLLASLVALGYAVEGQCLYVRGSVNQVDSFLAVIQYESCDVPAGGRDRLQ